MNDWKNLLDYLEEEDRHLNGFEAISLLHRIKGFVKESIRDYDEGFAKQMGEK